MRLASLLVVAGALAAAEASAPPASAQVRLLEANPERSIEVTGEASIEAAPDFATVTLGVTTTSKEAGDAMAANAKAVNALIAALKNEGVAAADIRTSSLSVSPSYSNPAPGSSAPAAIVGYNVENMVTVTVHDLSRLGALIDKAAGSGANAMYGVTFGRNNVSALLDEARPRAFADAKRKADIYASAAGAKVGRLMELSEGGGEPSFPRPRIYASAARAAAPTPIEPGQDKVWVTVTTRFELTQ